MIFNSIIFIFFFLPLALISYYLTPMKYRRITLLILSVIFFFWTNSKSLILILFSLVINYVATMIMDARKEYRDNRVTMLVFLVTFNVLILLVFKYLGFFTSNLNALFKTQFYIERLIQPLGLSFYTFQVLSYNFDVFKGKIPSEKSFLNLALYLLMFPQLASGPIMRYSEIRPQINPKFIKLEAMYRGVERFIIGLFKKVYIANSLGALWTIIRDLPRESTSLLSAWVGIIAFTLYIYYDFSGYMDMAIGMGGLFGYKLNENFNYPYLSKSVSEFWRRWHITLGSWFRDYIYIPMGGSRTGSLILNTMAVWLLTGLWHGASWNFILWGLYFGIIVLLEKYFLGAIISRLPEAIQNLYTMFLVVIGWVIFDTKTLEEAGLYLGSMFFKSGILIDKTGIYYLYTHLIVFILAFLLLGPRVKNFIASIKENLTTGKKIIFVTTLVLMFFISVAYILNQSYSPSMYIGF